MYIISACLMGTDCKYDGGNNRCQRVIDFVADKSILEICPEELGGLTTPRPPAEQSGDRVINKEGTDVTEEFRLGAQTGLDVALAVVRETGDRIEGAILKARSPSCGCGEIYDGTFTKKVIKGDGYFAKLLKEQGINVITEEEKIDD